MGRVGEVVLIAFIVVPLIGPGALSQAGRTVSVLRRWPITLPSWRLALQRFARWCVRDLALSLFAALVLAVILRVVVDGEPLTLSTLMTWWTGLVALGIVFSLATWLLGWLLGLLWYIALHVAAAWHSHAQPRHGA